MLFMCQMQNKKERTFSYFLGGEAGVGGVYASHALARLSKQRRHRYSDDWRRLRVAALAAVVRKRSCMTRDANSSACGVSVKGFMKTMV